MGENEADTGCGGMWGMQTSQTMVWLALDKVKCPWYGAAQVLLVVGGRSGTRTSGFRGLGSLQEAIQQFAMGRFGFCETQLFKTC